MTIREISKRRSSAPLAVLACLVAAACGGGSSPPPTPTTGGGSAGSGGGGTTGPVFTTGVFQPSSVFINRCENPRTGVDSEGNPFPDQAGSTLEENFYLRSWTNETYLFNTEVVDQDPANFATPIDYFDVLITTAITPSGKPKDEFHFTQPTDEFLEQRNSAPSATYGATIFGFQSSPPRDFRVLYTEPGSPAAQIVGGLPNFVRGARILEVDGVDLVNADTQADIDALNAGLFPTNAGELHTFLVEDPGSAPRTVMLTSVDLAPSAVNRTSIINTPTGDVGYMLLNTFSTFSSEQEISNAITSLLGSGVNDLILDLRYNGGGLLAVASQLSYQIAGDARTAGRTFEFLQFNAAAGNLNPVTGQVNSPTPFFNTGLGFTVTDGTPLNTLNLPRVFVLSTDLTCSASESVINSLRGINVEVILIGTKTCGKPFGFFPQGNCGTTYFTTQFQGTNDQGFGDYQDGFIAQNSNENFGVRVPGCAVADDLTNELGDPAEAMLAAALQFREDGTCPTPPASGDGVGNATVSSVAAPGLALTTPESRDVYATNRDMTMPN